MMINEFEKASVNDNLAVKINYRTSQNPLIEVYFKDTSVWELSDSFDARFLDEYILVLKQAQKRLKEKE